MKSLAKLLLITALTHISAAEPQSGGPTPYPEASNKAAWPGEGPVRLHKWMRDNRAFFWSRREADRGAIVFVGDSLTGNLKASMIAEVLPGMKIANRGIGGDVTRGVLFRFREDVLDLDASQVVLCIGTNDLSAHADPSVIIKNIVAILDQASEAKPDLEIVLCTVPPRADPKAPLKTPDALATLNASIKQLAGSKPNLTIVDLFAELATTTGEPNPEYYGTDLLHLNDAGGKKWLNLVKPVLKKNAGL